MEEEDDYDDPQNVGANAPDESFYAKNGLSPSSKLDLEKGMNNSKNPILEDHTVFYDS